ncbi:MAG: TetR/AcrR family transcriptional regulator [Pseudonocardiaceae bacterium]
MIAGETDRCGGMRSANRQRILTAAADLIAEHGLAVSHDQIAKAAEVAVGTVYRRFPDMSTLIDALFSDQVDAVVASSRGALQISDPWQALVTFMTEILEFQASNRGLGELSTASGHGLALASYARTQIAPVVTELLARAHAAAVVRSDVVEQDLALVPVMIGAVIRSARTVDSDLWRRTPAIVLDGLRPIHQRPIAGQGT